MATRVQEIVSRRQALVARSAQQREHIARESAKLRESLWLVDLGVRGCQLVRQRRLLALGAIAALMILGPRRVLGAGYRAALLAVALLQLGISLKKLR